MYGTSLLQTDRPHTCETHMSVRGGAHTLDAWVTLSVSPLRDPNNTTAREKRNQIENFTANTSNSLGNIFTRNAMSQHSL